MTRSDSVPFDLARVVAMRKLIEQGEGHHLEFKHKASHPDKIVRELIAFANTAGGTLLVGVDDNRSIPGVRFPEEESLIIQQEIKNHCRPVLSPEETIIPVSEKRFVLRCDISPSAKRPHFYVDGAGQTSFVRQGEQTIRASREMVEIIRRSKSQRAVRLPYGEAEQKIIRFLGRQPHISLHEISEITGLNRYLASRKIIRLVLSNVLRVIPTEKGDLFFRT